MNTINQEVWTNQPPPNTLDIGKTTSLLTNTLAVVPNPRQHLRNCQNQPRTAQLPAAHPPPLSTVDIGKTISPLTNTPEP